MSGVLHEAPIVNLAKWKRTHRGPDVDPVVEYWKCRVPTCVTRVGVTRTGIETLAFFNSVLARNHEHRITENEVMPCAEHVHVLGERR